MKILYIIIPVLLAGHLRAEIFDANTWKVTEQATTPDFMRFKNTKGDIYDIKGAGVLPVVKYNGKLHFLLMAALVEGGKDANIGAEPVYTTPSNYPADTDSGSIEMAARPEELGILGFAKSTIQNAIQKNGRLLPNAGMWFGNYGVPTYLVYLDEVPDIQSKLNKANETISKVITDADYDKLFPTESDVKRTDRIYRFDLVAANNVLNAIHEKTKTGERIVNPIEIFGANYKLSPYVARTLALSAGNLDNLKIITEAIKNLSKERA